MLLLGQVRRPQQELPRVRVNVPWDQEVRHLLHHVVGRDLRRPLRRDDHREVVVAAEVDQVDVSRLEMESSSPAGRKAWATSIAL